MTDTTRMFPRNMGHYKPEQVSIFGPYKAKNKSSGQMEFWICIALAFFAGVFVRSIWG